LRYAEGVKHEFQFGPGVHDNVFWNEFKPKALKWLMGGEE